MSTFTDAQNMAVRADGNVLVSAGAGTGKTRTVVERCLRILAEGGSLENLLMVTFTEAAAAEMRARIRKTLEEQLGLETVASRQEKLQEQLALLDTAHISTLHSFCLQLIRDHFHDLDLDPQVTVLDESQTVPLIEETLDALLERCYGMRVDYAAEVQRLVRRAGGSDFNVRALVLRLHRYTQTVPPSERWCEKELERLDLEEPGHWHQWLKQGFREWRDEWKPELEAWSRSPNVAACLEAIRLVPDDPRPVDMGAAMSAVAEAEGRTWPPPYQKGVAGKPFKTFFEEAAFLRSLAKRTEGDDPLAEDWQWLRGPTRALLRLAQDFTAEFSRAKRAMGGIDFADLEQLALRLLVDSVGQPTETARAWRERFTHVFVDECQDINAAQDAILRAVSRPEGNRFLVGDVKQSIYRFRLADPGIFRHYEERWRREEGGKRIALAENFRSRESVLHFINALFTDLMRPDVGGIDYDLDARLQFGAPNDRAPLATSPNDPRVELHVVHAVDAEANGEISENGSGGGEEGGGAEEDVLAIEKEARLVARRLRALHDERHQVWDVERRHLRAVEWRDMVVLLRSPAARVETFAKEFRRAGIPLAASRAGFYSALEVQDLLNLLHLLDNPLQDIPLAAVLRSPLVAMTPEELAVIRIEGGQGDKRRTFVAATNHFYYRSAGAASSGVSASARRKLVGFYEALGRWRALIRQTSVSHCLEVVLTETHYEALLLAQEHGRERVANVHRLLDLARQYDPFQRQGLYRFLRFISNQQDAELDQDRALVETTDAVRLMSIHRSKGLEFPVVVVACLGGQFNAQDLRGDVLLSSEFGLCARITPPNLGLRYPSLPWWLARRREQRELLGEEMRLLYVAMTRARDTLILTAFEKGKMAGTRWHERGESLTGRGIVKATSYFAWLRSWLAESTNDTNWSDARRGGDDRLRWEFHPEDDAFFRATDRAPVIGDVNKPSQALDLTGLRARLTWKYSWPAATQEPAKTNVSALRRRATEEDDEAQQLFRRYRRARAGGGLTAAEVGSAHHLFLQHVDLDRTRSLLELKNEAERLAEAGHLQTEEVAALDFEGLLQFWLSDLGRRVAASREFVHRELPFTARFPVGDLQALGLGSKAPLEEVVIVQGVVDLAILGQDGIEIIDFKTDRSAAEDLESRVVYYSSQIRLYAKALGAIYDQPVTAASLHFLAAGRTEPVRLQ